MITDPQAYLRYFDSIHRRTLRDVQALPEPAESWGPAGRRGRKVLEHQPDRPPYRRVPHVLRQSVSK